MHEEQEKLSWGGEIERAKLVGETGSRKETGKA